MPRDPPDNVVESWPKPNFENPPTQGHGLQVMELLLVVVVVIVVLLRIYSRVFLRHMFGYDDWMILPATVFCIGLTTTTALGNARYGWGKHAWDVPVGVREQGLRISWLSELFFTWSLSATKLSLCFFYQRLLGGPATTLTRAKRWLLYGLMALICAWALAFSLATILQCRPVQAFWIINMPGEKCVDPHNGLVAHATVDIATDVALYLLPIPAAYGLRLPRRQKALVLALFALGGLVCIAAILRLPATIRSMTTYDVTWNMWTAYIWTVLECDLAIICASLPSLTPLAVRLFPSLGEGPCGGGGGGPRRASSSSAFSGDPSRPGGSHEMKPALRLFPNSNMTYPLGSMISTSAYPEHALPPATNGGGWWGSSIKSQDHHHHHHHHHNHHHHGHHRPASESAENIFARTDSQEVDDAMGIVKTTVIEQRYEKELESTSQLSEPPAAAVRTH